MPAITITIPSSFAVRSAEGKTLVEAVEAALKSKAIIEALNLGGLAGYHWRGVEVSAPEQRNDRWNGESHLRNIWDRIITVKWQAMQTLPQELSGEQNPVKDVCIRIHHGPEFADTPAVKWGLVGDKLVAA